MKLTQNPCRIRLPNTKSANALSVLTLPVSTSSPLEPSIDFGAVFFAAIEALDGGRSEVCMRSDAVRTNWPTDALKPERKALKGYRLVSNVDSERADRFATYIVSSQNTIKELHHSHYHKPSHEDVKQNGP